MIIQKIIRNKQTHQEQYYQLDARTGTFKEISRGEYFYMFKSPFFSLIGFETIEETEQQINMNSSFVRK